MEKKKIPVKDILEYVLFTAIGIAIFTFVLKVAVVSGNSMNDTYQDGDYLLCNRLGKPERGDVIICSVSEEKVFVKRIIGVGGDVIDIDFENGIVYLNDVPLEESYIKEPTHLDEGGHEYPVTVPEDCFFVMGDNRNHSTDSRDGKVGFISKDQIQGEVLWEIFFH